jgi:hypothetical protein
MKIAIVGAPAAPGQELTKAFLGQGHDLLLLGDQSVQPPVWLTDLEPKDDQILRYSGYDSPTLGALYLALAASEDVFESLDGVLLVVSPPNLAGKDQNLDPWLASQSALWEDIRTYFLNKIDSRIGLICLGEKEGPTQAFEQLLNRVGAAPMDGFATGSNPGAFCGDTKDCVTKAQQFFDEPAHSFFSRIKENPFEVILASLLFVFAFDLYFVLASKYSYLPGFGRFNNLFFGADHIDKLRGWALFHDGVNPLVPLGAVPGTWFLKLFTSSHGNAVLMFCGVVAALAVSAFFVLCKRLTDRRSEALAMSLLFCFSMSQLYFSGVPGVYGLATLSLIPTYLLALHSLRAKKMSWLPWVGVATLSFGILMINVIQPILVFLVVLYVARGDRKGKVKKLLCFVFGFVLLTGLLSVFQRLIFPSTEYFFASGVYESQLEYLERKSASSGVLVDDLFKNVFIRNFIGAKPKVAEYIYGERLQLQYYKTALNDSWLGMFTTLLWLGLLVKGTLSNFMNKKRRPFVIAVSLAVIANLSLHTVYGNMEVFQYSTNYTFLVLLLCVGVSKQGKLTRSLWWILVVLVAFHNWGVIRDLVKRYAPLTIFSKEEIIPVIKEGDLWRYYPGRRSPGLTWIDPAYDDSHWAKGPGGFGYGDSDDATLLPEMEDHYSTVFTRHEFEIKDKRSLEDLWIDVDYDDGFVCFLNGQIVAQSNAPRKIFHQCFATETHEAGEKERFFLPVSAVRDGRNVIAIIGLNDELDSSDLSLIVDLTRIGGD